MATIIQFDISIGDPEGNLAVCTDTENNIFGLLTGETNAMQKK